MEPYVPDRIKDDEEKKIAFLYGSTPWQYLPPDHTPYNPYSEAWEKVKSMYPLIGDWQPTVYPHGYDAWLRSLPKRERSLLACVDWGSAYRRQPEREREWRSLEGYGSVEREHEPWDAARYMHHQSKRMMIPRRWWIGSREQW